jgi:hypothetical protein
VKAKGKVKTYSSFYTDKSRTFALRQMKIGTVKYHGQTSRIYLNDYFLEMLVNIAMVRIFKAVLDQR